ncbi:GtrA family protein [Mycobacteroides abscessus]|uniref:GtrA-like protein n=2 Tax=Mycobacteroides abscessus TaxID=36809 RepID=A0A0U0ZM38_9MYCO|nr:GtrA family protein [Mycobacteroides abscessus]MBL3733323.1 GtrA family protein [Mycobacteroides abscessus subsp. massiliense]MBL3760875.1 GtrA family protein [Mycobacteroides abscessus subsp. massiliense]MBN7482232.1 GtrA family protein [Mycobacteroides abscessus subsp. massiliense]MDB2213412.1 GtrA family protein [Mycobacteroides abscessus subsp. massiliense]MDM2103069.1 GtrA family protein [Mycobacteroides abscessus]
MSFADATIARLPRFIRPVAERHHELIKFGIVGATTFIIDSGIFYLLKLTVLESKPLTAKIISGIIAVIASYILNREWSFRDRGGRERHHEALLFFAFSGMGVIIAMIPLWVSSYIFELRVPNVSLTVENIADFISAYIIGNLLQMAFRFWAFRRWVFPDEFGRHPDQPVSLVTSEPSEADEPENVTPLHPHSGLPNSATVHHGTEVGRGLYGSAHHVAGGRSRPRPVERLSPSSEPRVSKTS